MRRLIDIVREAEFDYGDVEDDEDVPVAPSQPSRLMGYLDRYKALKHGARQQDRGAWRKSQQRRFSRDQEDAEATEYLTKRGIQKDLVGYKPFAFPLIRFGEFGSRSRNFLPAEMRHEMGNVTHEAGVSCYLGFPYKDGYTFDLPHPDRAAYDVTSWSFKPTEQEIRALWNYLERGTPMDLFLLHGHLKSYGEANDWLDLGADGEYLLDTNKPYRKEMLTPERLYLGRVNLVQYIIAKFSNGLDGLRDHIRARDEWDAASQ